MSFKAAAGLAERTMLDYRKILDHFFTHYPGALDAPREATMDYLSRYSNPCSYNIRFAILKVFWSWVVDEGYFRGDRFPLDKLKKRKPSGRIVDISEAEIARLLKRPNRDTFTGVRDFALLCLQIDCGIRPGEALNLIREDFHSERKEIVIPAHVAKTRVPRSVPLSQSSVDAILRLLALHPKEWEGGTIFCTETGAPLQVTSWSRRVAAYGKKAGISITAYSLRHVCALTALRRGMSAFTLQRLLGHSDISMTKRYLAISDKDMEREHTAAGVLSAVLDERDVVLKNKRLRKL